MKDSPLNNDSPELADQQRSELDPQLKQGYLSGEMMDIDGCQECQDQQSQNHSEVALEARLADLETQLQEKNQKLKELQERCDMMSKDAIKNSQKLKELQGKCDIISTEAIKKDQDVTKFRKLWKKAAMEHDKFRASGQGFYQITDEYLVELINHLRLDIRDLSIQYFDGVAFKGDRFTAHKPSYLRHLDSTTLERDGFLRYVKSSTRSHEVIQAFLWRVIVIEIFERFEWLGADTSTDFRLLRHDLKPSLLADPQGGPSLPNHEAERKFYTWSSTTISMLLASTDVKKANSELNNRTACHVECIMNTVDKLLRNDRERSFKDQLSAIIAQAFALDKEISRQVARVIWRFNVPQHEERPDHPYAPSKTGLVMAPAVFKRGLDTSSLANEAERVRALSALTLAVSKVQDLI
ncbi:hypothetical protein FGADI_10688 [Fusarium gaditjirri]|uniref:Uncharacterized protein n=1 Tax=Fusarium gaditjirri TaxID=282569 RepID=A0A8H4WQG1_9HYPO|nr:hypothetical protein FGADI_10688 [Fusarium gaditjirri]